MSADEVGPQNIVQYYLMICLLFLEKLPECLLKGDDSDLEIDPCALSPEGSLTSPRSYLKHRSTDALPQMEDILAALESKSRLLFSLVYSSSLCIPLIFSDNY